MGESQCFSVFRHSSAISLSGPILLLFSNPLSVTAAILTVETASICHHQHLKLQILMEISTDSRLNKYHRIVLQSLHVGIIFRRIQSRFPTNIYLFTNILFLLHMRFTWNFSGLCNSIDFTHIFFLATNLTAQNPPFF